MGDRERDVESLQPGNDIRVEFYEFWFVSRFLEREPDGSSRNPTDGSFARGTATDDSGPETHDASASETGASAPAAAAPTPGGESGGVGDVPGSDSGKC